MSLNEPLTFIWCVRGPCYLPFKFCEVLIHQVHLYLVFARLKELETHTKLVLQLEQTERQTAECSASWLSNSNLPMQQKLTPPGALAKVDLNLLHTSYGSTEIIRPLTYVEMSISRSKRTYVRVEPYTRIKKPIVANTASFVTMGGRRS